MGLPARAVIGGQSADGRRRDPADLVSRARANTTMKSRSVIDKQTWRHLVAGWLRTAAGSGSTEAQVAEQCNVFQRTVQRIKAKIRSEELRYPWSGRSWSLRTPGNTAAVSAAMEGN